MSIRQYRPRTRNRRLLSGKRAIFLNALFLLTLLLEVIYPLIHGEALRVATIATVYCGALAMVLHSHFAFGPRFSISFFLLTSIYAFSIELIGTKTGWPFGTYHYDHSLGFAISTVPLLVPCAWVMMSYPILIAARRVGKSWVFLYGGLGLMAWDLFLDPQMVAAHRWSWAVTKAATPFAPEIPLSNSAGWLFSGMGLMALLHWALPKDRRKNGANLSIPNVLLGWALFSGVVGNLFFFHRPGVALFGGAIFGAVLAPYFFELRFGRPDSF
jgi:uncharacterized membrane protein